MHQDRYTRALVPITGAEQFRVDRLVQIRRTRPVGDPAERGNYWFGIIIITITIIIIIIVIIVIFLTHGSENKKIVYCPRFPVSVPSLRPQHTTPTHARVFYYAGF